MDATAIERARTSGIGFYEKLTLSINHIRLQNRYLKINQQSAVAFYYAPINMAFQNRQHMPARRR